MNRDTLMVYVEIVIKSILGWFLVLSAMHLQKIGYFNDGYIFSCSLIVGVLVFTYFAKKFYKIIKSFRFDVIIVVGGTILWSNYYIKLDKIVGYAKGENNFIKIKETALMLDLGVPDIVTGIFAFISLACVCIFILWVIKKMRIHNNKCKYEGEEFFLTYNNPEDDLIGDKGIINQMTESILNGNSPHPLIFGIDGPWGIGKSTIIEKTIEILNKKEKVIVVKVNVLRFVNRENILELLIREIVTTVTQKEYVPEMKANYAAYLNKISGKFPWIDVVLNFFGLSEELGTQEMFRKIGELHRLLGIKLVILVDDLDRMEAVERNKILSGIREAFNLPFVTFVLCYDTHNFEKDTFNGGIYYDFFEKYVDVKLTYAPSFDISLINKFVKIKKEKKHFLGLLKTWVEKCGYKLVKSKNEENSLHDILENISQIKSPYKEKIDTLYDTPRKLKRLYNQIQLCLHNRAVNYEGLDPVLLCALLYIYVHFPKYYADMLKLDWEEDVLEKLNEKNGSVIKFAICKDILIKRCGDPMSTSIGIRGHLYCIANGYYTPLDEENNAKNNLKELAKGKTIEELNLNGDLNNEKNHIIFYSHLVSNKSVIKIKIELLGKLINYILLNLHKHCLVEFKGIFGFREKGPYYLAKLIDKLADKNKIQEIIFNQEGVIEKMTDEINILKINDILVFRLTCFWGRGSSLGNLYAAMDDDKKNFENLSVTIFSKVKEYIMRGNIFALIDSLKFSELTGKYSIPELEGEKKNKILDNEKNKLMQFVIYQLTNAERDSMGWGCGCYKLDNESIQEVMSEYIMKKIVDKGEYLIRYLFVCIKSAKFKFASFDEELDVEDKERLMEDIAKTFSADSLKTCVVENWKKINPEEKTGYFYYNEEKVTYEEAYKEVDSYVSVWAGTIQPNK